VKSNSCTNYARCQLSADFRDQLWDTIICLCMCKGGTRHVNVLEWNLRCKTTNKLDICLPNTVKRESKNYISDKISEQNLRRWCHTSHRSSCKCWIQICLNDDCHAAFIHAFNCMMFRTDLVHVGKGLKIAYDRSWKSRRRSWMRTGEQVGIY